MLSAPLLAIYALWQQRKLRQQLAEVIERAAKQNDALHRELVDLKRQVATLPRVEATPAEPHPEPTLRVSATLSRTEQPAAPPAAVVLKPETPALPIPLAPGVPHPGEV